MRIGMEEVHPRETMWLVLCKNDDGRVCAWARGTRGRDYITRLAVEYWRTHGENGACYLGERSGDIETHVYDHTSEEFRLVDRQSLSDVVEATI